MSTTTTTALLEPSGMSHRRQPVRQTRVNPSRGTGGRTLGGDATSAREEGPPGFFPGITHFTDSIAALPKEMSHQFTMLKEVDAKVSRPEDTLKTLVAQLLAKPPAPQPHGRPYPVPVSKVVGRAENADDPTTEEYDSQRRELSLQLRVVLNNMNHTMDEKTHVMTAATDALSSLLKRCESSWPQIEDEISEETRLGNPNHRALDTEAVPEKKPSAVGERPRREAAMSNAHAALAEERENLRTGGTRKNRIQQIDSDFDEPRPTKSKAKNRKHELQNSVGLGIVNGSNKRRKVEKNGGQAMDRGGSLQGRQVGTASPSQTPNEGTKKRARGNAMAGAVGGRKRAGTANSNTNSPAMASSPVMGNFSTTGRTAQSPAMGTAMQRTGSTRARQNSAQHTMARSASAARHETGAAPGVTEPTSHPKNGTEPKTAVKVEEGAPPAARATSATATSTKKEDKHRPPSITTSSTRNGRASKTGTPTASSFPEATRPRSGRAINPPASFADQAPTSAPPKRSHKKGAGLAAQQQKAAAEAALSRAAAAAEEAGSGRDEEDEGDEEEPTYCYCGGVSYGEMVACDGPSCAKEWFHLDCAGLTKAPKGNEKWFCRDCQPRAQRVR